LATNFFELSLIIDIAVYGFLKDLSGFLSKDPFPKSQLFLAKIVIISFFMIF